MSAYSADECMMVLVTNQSVAEVSSLSLEAKINRKIEIKRI
jgi:hypothetical protein